MITTPRDFLSRHPFKKNRSQSPLAMQRNASTHSFLDWMTEAHPLEDLPLANEIVEKLSHSSATPLATIAFQSGRRKLAMRLLDCDPEPVRRVRSLLGWREYRAAFVEASESGSPDLLYAVTLKLRDKMAAEEFRRTVGDFPLAVALYRKYCGRFDVGSLYDVCGHEGDHGAQAQVLVRQALDEDNSHMRGALLGAASEAYKRSRHHLHASLCEDQSLLVTFQKQMDERHAPSRYYAGRTVHETCALLMREKPTMVEEFRSVFGIPERRFWWLRLHHMRDSGDWTGLERLYRDRDCPLGPEAFVDVCLERGNVREAEKYLARVRDRFKVKYYVRVGKFEEAAQVAVKRRDHRGLLLVRNLCQKDATLTEKVNRLVLKVHEADCQMWRSFA